MYNFGKKFDQDTLSFDLPKVSIKTEVDEEIDVADDLLVDCSNFLNIIEIKPESFEVPVKRKKSSKKKKRFDIDDDEHARLRTEVKEILKKKKDKK